MKKIKQNKPNLKIPQISGMPKCPENISFSFRYFTTNKNYNFERFKTKQEGTIWKAALLERLIEISQKTWLEWQNIPKVHGYEILKAHQIHFSPKGYTLSDDENIIVFRFYSQNGRILGIKSKNCATYEIIGLDMDFSAYDH